MLQHTWYAFLLMLLDDYARLCSKICYFFGVIGTRYSSNLSRVLLLLIFRLIMLPRRSLFFYLLSRHHPFLFFRSVWVPRNEIICEPIRSFSLFPATYARHRIFLLFPPFYSRFLPIFT